MTVRCNRLGNLFVRRVVAQIIFLYAFFAIPAVIWMIAEGAEWIKSWWVLLIIALIPTIASLALLSCYPQAFTLENKQLIWMERLTTQRHNHLSCRTAITVGGLHSIEFLQTPLERLFNMGRIRFLGDIRSLEAREAVERPIIPFYYGGICGFDRFQAELRQTLPERAFKH